jgi:hypothetical protein
MNLTLFLWHMGGSHNDLNVLHHSPVFSRVVEGNAHMVTMRSMATHVTNNIILLMASIWTGLH